MHFFASSGAGEQLNGWGALDNENYSVFFEKINKI